MAASAAASMVRSCSWVSRRSSAPWLPKVARTMGCMTTPSRIAASRFGRPGRSVMGPLGLRDDRLDHVEGVGGAGGELAQPVAGPSFLPSRSRPGARRLQRRAAGGPREDLPAPEQSSRSRVWARASDAEGRPARTKRWGSRDATRGWSRSDEAAHPPERSQQGARLIRELGVCSQGCAPSLVP